MSPPMQSCQNTKKGEVQLICKEDGIIAGLMVFERVFTLLDSDTQVTCHVKDGDEVKKAKSLRWSQAISACCFPASAPR